MTDVNFDVIVVGGGTIGLSAAYYAASKGKSVALFDQYGLHNDNSSSKGLERFFRILYATQARVRLVESSYAMWHEIENYVGFELLDPTPLLFFGDPDKQTVEGSIGDIEKAMQQMGIPYTYLGSPNAIQQAFPIFDATSMPSNYVGLVQESATINVGNSFRAFQSLAMQAGVPVHIYTGSSHGLVTNIEPISNGSGGYTVQTNDKTSYGCDHIILAPGIWLNNILPFFGLEAMATGQSIWEIWKCTLAFFPKRTSNNIPLWYEFASSDQELYYGFPDVGFTSATQNMCKIAADYTYTTYTNVNQIDLYPDQKIIQHIQTYLSQRFAENTFSINNPRQEEACFYSMAPDFDMVIGRIPVAPESTTYFENASMFVMASGRGFKFTPIFGRILADLAITGETAYSGDLDDFSPSRSGIFQSSGVGGCD